MIAVAESLLAGWSTGRLWAVSVALCLAVAAADAEIRLRERGGFPDRLTGVDLMNQAFGRAGKLTDPSTPKGEQEGTRAFFAGAYAILRNPAGHREVNYDGVSEATDAV